MEPFALTTERFLLDQPVEADVDDIASYCTDPVFERFLTTPWPYRREHATFFVQEFVPQGWAKHTEWTWAIREGGGRPLLGVVGVRLNTGTVGYWLGAPHRGRGVMPEALAAVVREVFARTDLQEVLWACVVGNIASRRVAQKVGFELTGQGPRLVPSRDGGTVESWRGRIRPAHQQPLSSVSEGGT